jgi:hypothetical protein
LIRGHKDRHGITETYGSILVRIIKKICSLTKHMHHTFQQSYEDDNKMFYNKNICTGRERMNLLTKRETSIQNCNTYERIFMCYETDTESDAISITSFSITC